MAEKNITWPQINNVFSLIASAVMISASFFTLSNKVDSLKQDIGYIKEKTTEVTGTVKEDNIRINDHETRIALLERTKMSQEPLSTNIAISSASASTRFPIPTPILTTITRVLEPFHP